MRRLQVMKSEHEKGNKRLDEGGSVEAEAKLSEALSLMGRLDV